MKAAVVHEFGPPDVLRYEEVPIPTPGEGEVLIKVESASVNFADIMRRRNDVYPFPTPLPFIPGSEVAGTVEALGAGVTTLERGAPVFCLVGQGSNGYAEYATAPAERVIPIPEGVTMDEAAALPVAGTTALLALRDLAKVQPGETVLVQGAAGGVGNYAVQVAKLLGAGTVIGATRSERKAPVIKASGADYITDVSDPTWVAQVREWTGGRGADVILEVTGGAVFAQSLHALAPFGRLIVLGKASGVQALLDESTLTHFLYDPSLNQTIHVFNLGLWFGMRPEKAAAALEELIGYTATGQVKVPIGHVFPLAQAGDAHRMVEAGETAGKVILRP